MNTVDDEPDADVSTDDPPSSGDKPKKDRCSFCSKTRREVKVLIAGIRGAMICGACCKWAASPVAPLAHCSSCSVSAGRHAPECPEVSEAS